MNRSVSEGLDLKRYVTIYTKFVLSGADVSGIRKHLGKVWQSERVSVLSFGNGPDDHGISVQLAKHFFWQRLIFTS